MQRRDFIGLIAGAAAWPLAALAQQPDRVARLGVLMTSRVNAQSRMDAIQLGLQKLGWIEGRNIRIEYRWAVGDIAEMRALAKELVNTQPDILIVHSSIAVQAVMRETGAIPIVFVHVADPVGQGFVTSAARPGGNVTGFSNFEASMGSKWLALLKEIAPNSSRVALVANPDTTPYTTFFRAVEPGARRLGVELVPATVRNMTDLENAVRMQGREPNGALILLPDGFISTHREQVITLVAHYRLPAIYSVRFFGTSGGLISYGVDPEEPFGLVPAYISRILTGERPGDLPVQAPTKFELVVNIKTANALGLTLPPTLQASADEVIE